MKEYAQELETGLNATLQTISAEPNALLRADRSVQDIKETIEKLRMHVSNNPITDKQDETYYLKIIVPTFYSRLLYYQKVYQLELEKKYTNKESIITFIIQDLREIDLFTSRRGEFCRYYFSNSTAMDAHFFSRGNWNDNPIEEIALFMSADFSIGSYWASRILANSKIREFLKRELFELERPPDSPEMALASRKLNWVGKKVNLVELCLGIFLTGGFGKATFKDIVEWFECNAGIDLGHYYNTVQEIERRNVNMTKYLDEMKGAIRKKASED